MTDISYRSDEYANQLKLIMEINPVTINEAKIEYKTIPAVYIISHFDDIIFVGQSENLQNALKHHGNTKNGIHKDIKKPLSEIRKYKIRYFNNSNESYRFYLKNYIISILKPKYNFKCKNQPTNNDIIN